MAVNECPALCGSPCLPVFLGECLVEGKASLQSNTLFFASRDYLEVSDVV